MLLCKFREIAAGNWNIGNVLQSWRLISCPLEFPCCQCLSWTNCYQCQKFHSFWIHPHICAFFVIVEDFVPSNSEQAIFSRKCFHQKSTQILKRKVNTWTNKACALLTVVTYKYCAEIWSLTNWQAKNVNLSEHQKCRVLFQKLIW